MEKLAASNISLYDARVRTEMDTSAALKREQERLSQIETDVKKDEDDIRTLNEKVKLLVDNEKDVEDEKIVQQWLELKREHGEAFLKLDIAAIAAQKHAKKYSRKRFTRGIRRSSTKTKATTRVRINLPTKTAPNGETCSFRRVKSSKNKSPF